VSIPLTFDWLTVTWLETRVRLWWRERRLAAASLSLFGLLTLLVGCVPATRFEEAQSAAEVELAGRLRAEQRASALEAENSQLQAQMRQQTQVLDEREQALSQAQLDSTTQGKQRQEAEGIVEQLRGELARVGGHLQSFGDDKQKLTASLDKQMQHELQLARLMRDATLLVGEPLKTGEYTLDVERGEVVLRTPRAALLAEDGSVRPEAGALLGNVARVLSLHPSSKLSVHDSSAPADAIAVQSFVAALNKQGVGAERIVPLAVDGASSQPGAGAAELVLAFSVP
jgi:hypothetical protein